MRNKRTLSIIMAVALIFSVLQNSPVSAKIKINAKSRTLTVGQSTTLKVTGTKKKATWSSSNKKVASVTKKGKVMAKKEGKATIKAKVSGKTYNCNIVVVKKNDSKPTQTKEPTPTEKPNEEPKGTIKIEKLLCEDENISVTFQEIRDGKIVLRVKNNCDNDITFGAKYYVINGKTYYDDFSVEDIYSNTEKEIKVTFLDDNWDYIEYCFEKGEFSGRVYYYPVDSDESSKDEKNLTFYTEI